MKKRAIVIGIGQAYAITKSNYSSFSTEKNVARIMQQLSGKDWDSIDLILEKNASRTNIINAVGEIMQKSGKGDVILFYYYGHADKSLTPGVNETASDDPFDEYMVTYDNYMTMYPRPYPMKKFLSDNDYTNLFISFLTKNPEISLISIFDCCFSLGMVDGGLRSLDNHLIIASSSEKVESWANQNDGSYFNQALYVASKNSNSFTALFSQIENNLIANGYPKPYFKPAQSLAKSPLII